MNVSGMSREQLEEVIEECYADTRVFSKVFFPHVFTRPFSSIHDEIFKILDDDSIKLAAISAPRGIGKSSIVNFAYPAKQIIFRDRKYIIPISETSNLAVEQAENLKLELESNDYIKTIFPDFQAGAFIRDTKDEWITGSGTKVLPRGAGQQIRGRKYKHFRPDLFIVDDLESDESVENEDRRRKLKNWFFSTVVNSVDRGNDNWRIVVIGTILHEASLLSDLLNDPDWYSVRLDLCDNEYNSNWPEFMTTEQVKALAESFRQKGMLDVFYREYRGLPISLENQGFPSSVFRHYQDLGIGERFFKENRDIDTVILFDPAKTVNSGSCNTSIMALSIDTKRSRWYIRDIVSKRMFPDETMKEIFEMADRTGAFMIAPEVTGLNEYLLFPLKNAMALSGRHYMIAPISPREPKASKKRSGALVPLYRQGQVWHNGACCGALERYLMEWPRPSRWDEIDCLSGAVYLSEQYAQYFQPAERDIEEEFAGITNEPALLGWRRI